MSNRPKPRKQGSEFVGAWVPRDLAALLNKGVRELDSDRSKFIRQAVREKLARHSISNFTQAS